MNKNFSTLTTTLPEQDARDEAERRARLLALLVWVDGTVSLDGDTWTVTSNIGRPRATVSVVRISNSAYQVEVRSAA